MTHDLDTPQKVLEAAAAECENDVNLCVQARMGSTASALSAAAIRIRALAARITPDPAPASTPLGDSEHGLVDTDAYQVLGPADATASAPDEPRCSGHVWAALDGYPAQCSVCGAQRRASPPSAVDVEALLTHLDKWWVANDRYLTINIAKSAIIDYFARLAASGEREG